VFVDVEAYKGCPMIGRMTEFGAVEHKTRKTFHGKILESVPDPANPVVPIPVQTGLTHEEYYAIAKPTFVQFAAWLKSVSSGRPIFVSDNPAYDFQWINDGFLVTLGENPFGHSARRLGDFYAGLMSNFFQKQDWKRLRVTPHTHHPVDDAMGNVEAFERMVGGER
jgi:hypothetical protein